MEKQKIFNAITFILLAGFLLIPVVAECEDFEYRHIAGMRYRILSVVDQSVLVNNQLSHTSQILNRIAAEVTSVTGGNGMHRAVFQTSERVLYDSQGSEQPVSSLFQWEREYETVFERDKLGLLSIEDQYYMPIVRNVPVFPGRRLNIGERWTAPGYEVHDFRDAFGIQEPYRIHFVANYEYLGERPWEGQNYQVFTINYNIATRPSPVQGRIYPVRISGTYNQTVYWDSEAGREKASEGSFRITYVMSDGRTFEFRSRVRAEVIEAEMMDRQQIINEIVDEINRLEIPDVNVRAVEEGISISLEDIRFHADSDRMLAGEHIKLDRIAEILMRYPDRDIMVSGHTALAGTADGRMRLSQDRARAVANYFLSQNVRSADRMVIRGFGAERPIADNTTEEGMRRNRRVEITILEN